jgi:hypothetical protein
MVPPSLHQSGTEAINAPFHIFFNATSLSRRQALAPAKVDKITLKFYD